MSKSNAGTFIPSDAMRYRPQPLACPEAYLVYALSQTGGIPSVAATAAPATREVLLVFEKGFIRAGVPIRSTRLPYGNLATVGTQTTKIRQCVYTMDSPWYKGDANNQGMHESILSPVLQHSAGISWADARTAGGGANARAYKFNFDGEYIPTEDQHVILCTAFELQYLNTDTAPSAVLMAGASDGGNGNLQRDMHAAHGGSYVGRNYFFNTALHLTGIDALSFATYENPAAAAYAISGGATISISSRTVTLNSCINLAWEFWPY